MLRLVILAAAIVFVVVNGANALHKGGDAEVFFEGGRRILQHRPLYEGSGAASGFIGPPMQALFFAPFATLADVSPAAAKLVWYGLNLACLAAGVGFWASLVRDHAGPGAESRRPLAIILPVAATLLPIQTNFEHQNMNALLLALTGGAAWLTSRARDGRAGALIGLATALKAFPALLIVHLASRGRWKGAGAALGTAAALTLLPAIATGPAAFAADFRRWLAISSSGWPIRNNNQSLLAAIDRFTGGWRETGVRSITDAPVAFALFLMGAVALVLLGSRWLYGTRAAPSIPTEMAAILALAVLTSPIAWDHYWVLLLPAFMFVYQAGRSPSGRLHAWIFWTAAVLTTGISRATVGRDGWALARQLSVDTVAALLLYLGLILWRREETRAARPFSRAEFTAPERRPR
jgi:glycosyl transferase family 87